MKDADFTDKTGQPIQPGDIVQLRAPGSAASDSLFVVAAPDGIPALFVPGTESTPGASGVRLTQEIAGVLLVVDRPLQHDD